MNINFKANIISWIKGLFPDYEFYKTEIFGVRKGKSVRLYQPVRLYDVQIGDYSYVGMYSHMKMVTIGKFCSIGPNCFFGWGIHPISGVSTSPMFYSTLMQNGFTLSKSDKIVEQKRIVIGNDVFIGMNVTILDGVTIGNGAVIGAGAVVSKDIPEFAVAVGNPIKVIKYRFTEKQMEELLKLKWWDFDQDKLILVERYFFDIELFIQKVKELND